MDFQLGNIEVQNEGSTARDHLANERTYLAWVRTGITMMGVGLALIKFEIYSGGIFFSFLGLFFVMYSGVRYFKVMNSLMDNKYIIDKVGVTLITIISFISIIGAFLFLFVM